MPSPVEQLINKALSKIAKSVDAIKSNLVTIKGYLVTSDGETLIGEAVSTGETLDSILALTPSLDAFARSRITFPETIFDSKQIFDNVPLLWDDQEVSGSGTSSTHFPDRAETAMAVSASTAGVRTRQTFMRFNYQPGKSHLVILTGVFDQGGTGLYQWMGYMDDENGVYFTDQDGVMNIGLRSNVSGGALDVNVAQADWNLDPVDGTGPSGFTLDKTKANIYFFDFEWLGVGTVRYGVFSDGKPVYVHATHNANANTAVYMSTPNLPIRYSIENKGGNYDSGANLQHLCSTVISEGGQNPRGIIHYESTSGNHVDANSVNTLYAIIGVRLRDGYEGLTVDFLSYSILCETNDNFEWVVLFNPTVAGTFTYSDHADGGVQTALGATANTVTGGQALSGGWGLGNGSLDGKVENARRLGTAIDGTKDTAVLCVRPLSVNADVQASITWRELS